MSEENNSGTTEATESEIVPLHELDDADLDAFLEAEMDALEHEEEQGPVTTKAEATHTPKVATGEQQAPKSADELNAPVTRAELNALLERLKGQEKKVDGQELLIQRRTSELGELKKQLKSIDADLRQRYQEALAESPADALDIRDEFKENKKRLEEVENAERSLARRSATQELVAAHVPQEEFDVEAMAESLARDGIPEQYIESFKRDPVGFLDGDYNPAITLIHVAKRAQAEKIVKQLYPIAQKLAERVKELESKQGDVLKQVEKVARKTPEITAAGSRPSRQGKTSTIDVSQVSKLSDEELDEILANANS